MIYFDYNFDSYISILYIHKLKSTNTNSIQFIQINLQLKILKHQKKCFKQLKRPRWKKNSYCSIQKGGGIYFHAISHINEFKWSPCKNNKIFKKK